MQKTKWFIVLVLTFCSVAAYSQVNDSKEISKISEQQRKKYIKEQSVLLLRNILLNSKSIENLPQKADVIAEASVAVWDYDRSFAKDSLLDFVNQSLADYEELLTKENKTDEEKTELQNLAYSIKKSVQTLAKKDIKTATSLQSRFFQIKSQAIKGDNLNEKLDLATEGLEFDERQTLNLLFSVIQQGIPNQFPKLIFELREKNPDTANALLQKAIQNLSVNPNYTPSDAVYLSVPIFNEPGTLLPSINNKDDVNNFFVFTNFVGNPLKSSDKNLIAAYYQAAQNFFNLRLQNQANGFFDSPQNLIQSYFLIEKLKSYGQVYGFNDLRTLNSISIPIATLMQTAGFSEKTLAAVRGYAQRLADSNNPLGLDSGTDLLEKAENAKSPQEKLDYLIRGIIRLIETAKYTEAERKIFDVQNSDVQDSLYLLLNTRANLDFIEQNSWREFDKKVEKISDKRIKAFLYLKTLSVSSLQEDKSLLSEYALKAEKNIGDISDKTAKAAAYIYLTSLLLSSNQTDGILILPNAVKAVNEAADYDGDEFEINLKIPTRQTYFAEFIGANSFKNSFAKLAEIDWNDSQIQALQVKRKGLQAIAQVAAAQAVLKEKNLPK